MCSIMISVIVPIYNIDKYLNRCIESICNQTYTNLQIILVNDGSSDNSGKIVDEWVRKDSRIYAINKCNGGLVSARKAGISAAKGIYSVCIDGDDWIEEHFIEKMVGEADSCKIDAVLPGYIIDNGNFQQAIYNSIKPGLYELKDIVPIMLYRECFYKFGIIQYACSKLFKTEILRECQMNVPNEVSWGEDVAITYPSLLHAEKIKVIRYAGYHYVQRMESLSNKKINNANEKCRILINYLKNRFKFYKMTSQLMPQLCQYAKLLYLSGAIEYLDSNQEEVILCPFGGIEKQGKVVLYGAGAIGRNVRLYLEKFENIDIIAWLDKNYERCGNSIYDIISPEQFDYTKIEIDYIIVCISDAKIITEVVNTLSKKITGKIKIKALTDNFMDIDNSWGLL